MKQFFGYFLKVRKELKILLVIAVVGYFFIELLLSSYSSLFPGADKIGQFLSKLCIAYISAFIFYFIVVHIKSEKDKHNVNEFVGHEVYSIITSAHLLIQPFLEKTEPKARFRHLNPVELQELLRSVQRQEKEAPYSINGQKTSWLEWYEYLKEGTIKHINNIMIRYPHLDSGLIKQLTRIENSLFFTQFNRLYDFGHDATFGIFYLQLQTYLEHIKELEVYAEKHLKKYQYLTSDFIGKRNWN